MSGPELPEDPVAGDPPEQAAWNQSSLSSGDPLAGAPAPPPPPVAPETPPTAAAPVPPGADVQPPAPAWGTSPAPPVAPPPVAPPPGVPPATGWAGATPGAGPQYQLASWGSRVGAALIDGVLVALIAVVLAIPLAGVVGATGSGGGALAALIGWFFLFLIAATLYAPVTMMRSGQTPGKKLVGIRVVRDDGQPMSFGYACAREILVKGLLIGGVGSFLGGIPGLINVFWPLVDDQNRAFHDMIVKSHVVSA